MNLKDYIATIPDFPQEGILFRDITPFGFVPIRKPNKLPRKTISYTYDLEYGSNDLHMHADAIKPGQKVLIIDDLLATGGTVEATIKMV